MAKACHRRRSSSQFTCLQRLASINQIAAPCVVQQLALEFTVSHPNWASRAPAVKLSVAKASEGDHVCRSSNRNPLKYASRQPMCKQHSKAGGRAWSPLSHCDGREIRTSK
jgi:hypothetical protein